MEQLSSSKTVFWFDSPAIELALHIVVPPVIVLGTFGIAWIFQNEVASMVAISLLSVSIVCFLEWIGRQKLILSDDTNRMEIAAGEKKLLRTLERLPWDNNRVRTGIAAAGAAGGCLAGFALDWANISPVLPTCLAGMVAFFSVLVAYIRMDQALALAYVQRGHAAYLANDVAAAIGDASESLILSLMYRYEAYMIRGLVWMRLEAYDHAVREFNLAFNERPDSEEARAGHEAAARRSVELEGRSWEEMQAEAALLLS